MKKYKNIFLLLLISIPVYTQSILTSVSGLESGNALLYSLQGEKTFLLDSIVASEPGNFVYSLYAGKDHPGFYRIKFNNNRHLDFIYDSEEIEIETDANNILDELKVIKSESNKIYYEFIKRNKDYKTKTELLHLILARYPEQDEYYNSTKEKLIQIQEDYLYFVNVTAQANPNSFIGRYVRSSQLPVIDVEIPPEKQLEYLKTHSLDNVNFYDDGLIYSDAYANKAIEYLSYYRNPQLPLELLEKEFMSAIDSILGKAKVNEIVYTHLVEYLLDGFKKFGFDNVINYIVENYVIKDDLCLDEQTGSSIQRRIDQNKIFKEGITLPNIVLKDDNESEIELYNLNSEKILVVFYSTTCPHCIKLLPELHTLYASKNPDELEIIAIALDNNAEDWNNFIQSHNFTWLNVNDTLGWDSKAASDYFIYATPTMFLADKDKKLLKIVTSVEEIL